MTRDRQLQNNPVPDFGPRGSGRSTRLIDRMVQAFFRGKPFSYKDHYEMKEAHNHLLRTLRGRLQAEHQIFEGEHYQVDMREFLLIPKPDHPLLKRIRQRDEDWNKATEALKTKETEALKPEETQEVIQAYIDKPFNPKFL